MCGEEDFQVYAALQKAFADRKEVQLKLMEDYDRDVYLPLIKKIKDNCSHRQCMRVWNSDHSQCRIVCPQCGKHLWQGPDDTREAPKFVNRME